MQPRESLKEMLVVGRKGPGRYACALESFWGEPVLGDLLARLVLAAATEGVTAPLRSLHATFTSAALAGEPLEVRLERRDEAVSFDVAGATSPCCSAIARYGAPANTLGYQATPAPGAPDPERLPSTLDTARTEGWPEQYARGPFEFRRVGNRIGAAGGDAPHVTWMRTRVSLGAEPSWHTAAIAFVSLFYVHWAFEWRLGTGIDYGAVTPLDHALWLHGAPRFDDWLLVVAHSDRAAGGVALAHRELYSRDGEHLATAVHSARVSMAPSA